MARAILHTSDPLLGLSLCGLPLAESVARTCVAAGLAPHHLAASAPIGAAPVVVVDVAWPAVSAATLRALVAGDAAAVLVAPGGQPVAAWLPAPDPTLLPADALAAPAARTLSLPEDEAIRLDDPWELARAERVVQRRILRAHALAGVRFVDPERVTIEASVALAPGVLVWPDVVLRGSTAVDEGGEIQSGAWIADTRVGPRAIVKPHSVCEGADIGADCQVGPFARLRPGAVLERDVRVGNYVEVKNTVLREGAKAQHLSYLGDAEVGADANIGAGTITCNYDGFAKHRTRIGRGAFIGSNTALVAPISIGDGAIVGAGSVITSDVPAGAVALERAQQRVLEGKAEAVNERNRKRAEQARR